MDVIGEHYLKRTLVQKSKAICLLYMEYRPNTNTCSMEGVGGRGEK
jgi:hypothetical protein